MAEFMQVPTNPWTGVPSGAPITNPMDALANYGLSIPDFGNMNFLSDVATQAVAAPVNTAASTNPGMWEQLQSLFSGAIGTKDQPGWGNLALGAAQGLGSAYLGMQQYGLAKDSFDESKRQFQMNWNAQKKTTNAALEDRQRARVASNPGAYQSVGDYMKENGI